MPSCNIRREQKDLSQEEDSPHKRSSQRAFHKPKGAHKTEGRCAWKKERPLLHDGVVGFRGDFKNEVVDYCEDDACNQQTDDKVRYIAHKDYGHHQSNHRERACQVAVAYYQWKEEYHSHLGGDGILNLLLTHSHFFHNAVTFSVVIALGNLLIEDNHDGNHKEHQSADDTKEEQTSKGVIVFDSGFLL